MIMSNNKRTKFREITVKIDALIDMADDKSLIDDYRTTDLLKLVEKGFDDVAMEIDLLPDIDLHKDK
jgi:hypothetical protein